MNWFSKLFRKEREVELDYPVPAETGTGLFLRHRAKAAVSRDKLPRFQSTVGGFDTRAVSSGADRLRAKLRTAFTPSHPVSDLRMFAGRTDVLAKLIRLIEDQQLHVVIYGDRGIGKTSLLHILNQLAQQARYTVVYASCGSDTKFSDLFRTMATEIPLLYHTAYSPVDEAIELGGTLADTLPEGEPTVAQVSNVLGKIGGTRVLMIIDEFDRAESARLREQVAELVKNISDRSMVVQLVIAGVAANLTELVAHIPSIRRNIIGLPIDAMTPTEVRELVANGESASGLPFSPDAIDSVIAMSNGSPYLANLLGQHAGLAATERDAEQVSLADVALGISRAIEEVRLRVSPHGLLAVKKLTESVGLKKIGLLAEAAMTHVGRIPAEDLSDDLAKKVADIIAPIEGEAANALAFREEALVPYVWLMSQVHRE